LSSKKSSSSRFKTTKYSCRL